MSQRLFFKHAVWIFCMLFALRAHGQFGFSYEGPDTLYVGASCTAILEWGHPGTPEAIPQIPGQEILLFEITSISGGYAIGDPVPAGQVVTVFYEAEDNLGNSALFGFNLYVLDTFPPVFDPSTLPQDVTITCLEEIAMPELEADDNCLSDSTPVTIAFEEIGAPAFCSGGTWTRQWTAMDDFENESVFIQTITVLPDTMPPVITGFPVPDSAVCGDAVSAYTSWLEAQRNTFTASDAGCGFVRLSDNAPPSQVLENFCGDIAVDFFATDTCGNQTSYRTIFRVTNPEPPVITVAARDSMADCSSGNPTAIFESWLTSRGGAEATDDCSFISWSTIPENPTLADTCNAGISVEFVADDGCGNTASTTATFFIQDTVGPVISSAAQNRIINCSLFDIEEELGVWISGFGGAAATDICTPEDQLVKTFFLDSVETDSAGIISALQDSIATGCIDELIIDDLLFENVLAVLEVAFTFADACGNTVSTTGVFAVTDALGPVFTVLPSDTMLTCESPGNLDSIFTQWYLSAGGAEGADDCGAVFFRGEPALDSAYQLLLAALDTACAEGAFVAVDFFVNDFCGNENPDSVQASFGILDSISPVIVQPATDLVFGCDTTLQAGLRIWLDSLGGAEAEDACGGFTWSFSWVENGDTLTGVPMQGPYPDLSGPDCNFSLEVTFTARDFCQNTVRTMATFSFQDTLAPVFFLESDTLMISCDSIAQAGEVTVMDNCSADLLIQVVDSVIAGQDTTACAQFNGLLLRTWRAEDACGNVGTAVQWIQVTDTIPPSFLAPSDTTIVCNGLVGPELTGQPDSLADNCDPAPTFAFVDDTTGQGCTFIIERTWIVRDACQNTATALQRIQVSDTIPPEFIALPESIFLSCDSLANLDALDSVFTGWLESYGGATFTDPCSGVGVFAARPGSYEISDTTTFPGIPPALPEISACLSGDTLLAAVVADVVIFDACGNAAQAEMHFRVVDDTPPEIISCDSLLVVPVDSNCAATVQIPIPGAVDQCFIGADSLQYAYMLDTFPRAELDTASGLDLVLAFGAHDVVFFISDCAGNEASCQLRVLVQDTTPPALICPDTIRFNLDPGSCSREVTVPVPGVSSGNCGDQGEILITFFTTGATVLPVDTIEPGLSGIMRILEAGTTGFTFAYADDLGNLDTCIFQVVLNDTVPPEAVCQSATLFISPSGLEPLEIRPQDIDGGSQDNCGIDSSWIPQPVFPCDSAGTTQEVLLVVADQSDNRDTCAASVRIEVAPIEPTYAVGICENDTLQLFANPPPAQGNPYTFDWVGPNNFVSNLENPIIPSVSAAASGTYIVTVTGINACSTQGTVEVVVDDLNPPELTAGAAQVCFNEAVVLSATAFSQEVTYRWYRGAPPNGLLLGSTINPSFIDIPPSPGDYTYYIIVESSACMSNPSQSVFVSVIEQPVASVCSAFITICEGEDIALCSNVSTPGLTYDWSGPDGYTSMAQQPEIIEDAGPENAGQYQLVVSLGECVSNPAFVDVTINTRPDTPVITGADLFCAGSELVLTVPNVQTADEYIWMHPDGSEVTTPGNTLTIPNIGQEVNGDWTVIAVDLACASAPSEPFSVLVEELFISIGPVEEVCEGDSVTLLVPVIPGASYAWEAPGNMISAEPNPTFPALEGTYEVTVITESNCVATASVFIDVNTPPTITALSNSAGNCADGSQTVTFEATIFPLDTGQYTYVWTGPNNFSASLPNPVIEGLTAQDNGTYQLTVFNGACPSEAVSTEINVFDIPPKPFIDGLAELCTGDTLRLSGPAMAGENISYQWVTPLGNFNIPEDSVLVIEMVDTEAGGAYTLVIDQNGCASEMSDPFFVNVIPPLARPMIVTNPKVCAGDTIRLETDPVSGAVYLWEGPDGFVSNLEDPLIFPAAAQNTGNYTLQVGVGNCFSEPSDPVFIEVVPEPQVPSILPFEGSVCLDDPEPVVLCIDAATATPGATYTWYNAGTGEPLAMSSALLCLEINDFSAFEPGLNGITVEAENEGCLSPTAIPRSIAMFAYPEMPAFAGEDLQICIGEEAILNADVPGQGSGMWISPNPDIVIDDPSDPMTGISNLAEGPNQLVWVLDYESCINYDRDTVRITLEGFPEAFTDSVFVNFGETRDFSVIGNDILPGNYEITLGQLPEHGSVLDAGDGTFRFTPDIGYVGEDALTYIICNIFCPDQCDEATVFLQIGDENDCFVPSIFTPNGDGVNDLLIIPCLETDRFPTSRMVIFNQWGDEVFSASPYLNDWDGRFGGDDLPVSTYFYVLDFGDGTPVRKGFLILER